MSVRRRRGLLNVRNLDLFPKTSEECKETSPTGGTVSLLSFALMLFLIGWETKRFFNTSFAFKFVPDTDFKSKLKLNVDITIATRCMSIGADVVDLASQQVGVGDINKEDTYWQLDADQQAHFDDTARLNVYLRESFHSIHEMMWNSGYLHTPTPRREVVHDPHHPPDACRISGSLSINKVAGNFHITPGRTIQLPGGHAHIAMPGDGGYNFTHRIDRFSFGDVTPGIIHPMEGDLAVAESARMSYQYFVHVVPTTINTYSYRGDACQYSVTELAREINHEKESHGTPGLFFKYEMSALRVEVREQHQETFIRFITRLAGITGGVFTCSGLLNRLVELLINCFFCRFFSSGHTSQPAHIHSSASGSISSTTPLISRAPVVSSLLVTNPPPLLSSSVSLAAPQVAVLDSKSAADASNGYSAAVIIGGGHTTAATGSGIL